ncbi:ubiquinone biosynthesis protein UbiB [Lysobacter avium]|uniref:Ubiquinone biosynthesis protein UbiB n=1 Tax=Novilysobacter avium TaxID=2781023 RepID=A0A7S6ZTJ9_9GAMM|nr:ubiquinone biosynthesis protein UbiB [Lysobacter avium]
MLWEGLSATRDLGRVYEIASILIRYGFGDMVGRLGLAPVLARAGRVLPLGHMEELVALPTPVRVRQALEEMGPSFVKLGQVLATRVDLFPPEWITEFGKLQNQAPEVPYELIRQQMLEDLGASPEAVFAWLDRTPLAAASIAQVHRARLHDGTEVVVKVRRPGIKPVVEADMRLLQRAAQAMEARFEELRQFQPSAMVRQFKVSLGRELDLAAECRHAERIAASFAGSDEIVVPAVHWQYTGPRMNVQDFVDGVSLSNMAAVDAAGLDRKLIARRGANAVLKMMFEDGFFHADPHPGNVFVLPGNRIALIDYGMVGRLSDARRNQVVGLLDALVMRDAARVTDVMLEWATQPNADESQMALDVDALVDQYHGVALGQLNLATMLIDVTVLLRANRLALPADLALMIKVFVTLEGLGRSLDPDFDMASEAAPFLRRAMLQRYRPATVLRDGIRTLADTAEIMSVLPRDIRRLLRSARRGNIKLHVDIDHLEDFGTQLNHSANRLTVGVVLAALIIGSSITLTVGGGPTLLGLPAFGLLGFVGAAIAGAWLVVSIWRSGGGR